MATRAPFDPYALPNLMRLSEADEEWYKPRYRAIQDLVHEMEDENNIIAFKISQIRHRLEMRQEALASQPIERDQTTSNSLRHIANPPSPSPPSPQSPAPASAPARPTPLYPSIVLVDASTLSPSELAPQPKQSRQYHHRHDHQHHQPQQQSESQSKQKQKQKQKQSRPRKSSNATPIRQGQESYVVNAEHFATSPDVPPPIWPYSNLTKPSS